jgi:nucleoid-associated protein YgaU
MVGPDPAYDAPSTAEPGTYVIRPSDTFWSISNRLYGTGAYFQALARHNRDRAPDEDRLEVGAEILAPDVSELERAYPDLCPKAGHRRAAERRAMLASTSGAWGSGRVYVVQQGDNVFDIARFELGKASRWVEILELNRELLGDQIDYLTPGMKLILPTDHATETVTQRPEPVFRR